MELESKKQTLLLLSKNTGNQQPCPNPCDKLN